MKNCVTAFLAGVALLVAAAGVLAQPVTRIFVGFPPGGTTDSVARLLSERLGTELNRKVIVENRPGAGGAIAAAALKAAPADGQTLMLAAIVNISLYPSLTKSPTYDPFKDFVPVTLVGKYDLGLAVNEASGVRDLPGFIKWTAANRAAANFGSPGTGSLPHLFGILLGQSAGIDWVHVPYQGAAPSITNLLGGQVGAVIQPLSDLMAHHGSGRLRILGHSGSGRRQDLPDVPTFKELGYPGLEGGGWIGFFAPAGTPEATVKGIWQAMQKIQQVQAISNRLRELGFEVNPMAPADFGDLTKRDAERWGKVVKASGIPAAGS